MTSSEMTWIASPEILEAANITWLMKRLDVETYDEVHAWSVQNHAEYWKLVVERLGLKFRQPGRSILAETGTAETPQWFPGARLNIVESCFLADPETPAILHQAEGQPIGVMTYGQLESLTDRVASSLVARGFRPGSAIATILPMTAESVGIYLGIVKAGCVVVGIPESFRPREIQSRLQIASAVAVFTQDVVIRGGKKTPLYASIIEANAPQTIVLPAAESLQTDLRNGDLRWTDFLSNSGPFTAIDRQSDDPTNILFSSGTTGDPKAIPWNQTTPIKCAADAHFHQDVHPGDVMIWPTSLGWMMGPWLIFASLLNRATMGLFSGSPLTHEFGCFVQETRATMLGVVPTLVKAWRKCDSLGKLDWTSLKLFSSTGECSTADDMRWLMARAGHKPVIEYCGGTEIGGGYITNTIARPCIAGTFNTAALGLDFVILNDSGTSTNIGELFLIPPSIGLSTTLLNKDHHAVYYEDTPQDPLGRVLRRHGDLMERLGPHQWRALGRADDTMNLSGIKVSSVEIEQVLRTVPGIDDIAAVAVSPDGGPSQLIIFAVSTPEAAEQRHALLAHLQQTLRRDLNPLFKIHDLVCVEALPRTASNKLLRRSLREDYFRHEAANPPLTTENPTR